MKEIITGIFIGTTKDFEENKEQFILNINCGREELNGALNLNIKSIALTTFTLKTLKHLPQSRTLKGT